MIGRDFLKRGLLWSIGNGHSIKIWSDPWLFYGGHPFVRSNSGDCCSMMVVGELLLDDYSGWNELLTSTLFEPEEADQICRLPLRRLHEPDRVIWTGTRNGIYSVKSGHYLNQAEEIVQQNSSPIMSNWS